MTHGFLCDLASALTSSPLGLGRGEGADGREEDREGQEAEEAWGRGVTLGAEDCLALPPTGPESLGFQMSQVGAASSSPGPEWGAAC